MDFLLMHPREQLVLMMERIYGYGMTTTSGGNLSILDDNGDIWITPGSVDKGSLRAEDIVCVKQDGTVVGRHKPSIEFPFHKAIYEIRPDVRAILHAHPPALVSFSIVRKIPDTRIIPHARLVCGEVGYAPYALPGSKKLGENIARTFAKGYQSILLENHGVVTAGENIFQAFQRFETLDFCARLTIKANQVGRVRTLSDQQMNLLKHKRNMLPEFVPSAHSSREKELRQQMCVMIRRSYDQQLVTSTEGTFSARLDEDTFLITPYGVDRKYIEERDLVLIHDGMREQGKVPSRSVFLHQKIYSQHPDIHAVIIVHPPNIMAYAVGSARFNTRTIPESYIVLRDIPVLPYGSPYMEADRVTDAFSKDTPMLLIRNDALLATGKNLLQAFDRIEVAEFSAKAVIAARALGPIKAIQGREIRELERAFLSS